MDRYGGGGTSTTTPSGRGQPYAPPPNTVQKGTVTRIEPYGCFVQLQRYRARGLVHKSQLAAYRVDSVEDAVSLNDTVHVKVVDVQREQDEDSGKVRHRISLSMKFASQDDGTDLDPSGEKAAEDMARRGGGEGGRGGQGGGDLGAGQNEAATALERNLGSNIGMASAIDPMAAMRSQRGAKVVLRGGAAAGSAGVGAGSSGPTFNGYALVDDDEGEPDMPPPSPAAAVPGAAVAEAAKPMGRGRGTTLPAWMTTRDEGPVGAPKESDRSQTRSKSDDSSSSSYDRRKRKKKDSRRGKKSSKHHRSRNRRQTRSRSRSRSRSRDRDRRKDSRSSRRKERRRDRDDDRKHRRRRRSRSRSRSRSHSSDRSNGAGDGQFASVEEAKALIARLEKDKAGRNQRQ